MSNDESFFEYHVMIMSFGRDQNRPNQNNTRDHEIKSIPTNLFFCKKMRIECVYEVL